MIEACWSSPFWAGGGDCYGSSPICNIHILFLGSCFMGFCVGLVKSFLGPYFDMFLVASKGSFMG